MIISLGLSFIAIASGALLTYTYDEDAPLASRLCSGACLGFALMGLVGFIFASFLGLNENSIGLTELVLATPFLLFMNERRRTVINTDVIQAIKAVSRATSKPDRWAFIYFLFYAGVMIATWLIFSRALLEKPEGLYTGVLNNYGDLPFHLSVITRFVYGQNFPPEDPTFAGARFTYPFLTDFISAMFVRVGASLRDSMFIENWIVGVARRGDARKRRREEGREESFGKPRIPHFGSPRLRVSAFPRQSPHACRRRRRRLATSDSRAQFHYRHGGRRMPGLNQLATV